MREIKFRAWDKEKKKMIFLGEPIIEQSFISCAGFLDEVVKELNDPESTKKATSNFELMQFTGLKDKNGKEIYEGDIILIDDIFKSVVKFGEYLTKNNGGNGWHFEDTIGWGLPLFISSKLEVIGNIYENPELLT